MNTHLSDNLLRSADLCQVQAVMVFELFMFICESYEAALIKQHQRRSATEPNTCLASDDTHNLQKTCCNSNVSICSDILFTSSYDVKSLNSFVWTYEQFTENSVSSREPPENVKPHLFETVDQFKTGKQQCKIHKFSHSDQVT